MKNRDGEIRLVIAGRPIEDAMNRVRRYCGLPVGHLPPETWAYRFYDEVVTDPAVIDPVDVATAGVLCAGLSQSDLTYFSNHAAELGAWLSDFPDGLALAGADTAAIERLGRLATMADAVSLSLLTKVLHRKRPELIPLIDREVIDWFRPLTGERRAVETWPALLHHLSEDLRRNADGLNAMCSLLEPELGRSISHVRLVDIAIWMGGQR